MNDKRTKPRFGPLVLRARVHMNDDVFDGYLTNVSVGGAFLAVNVPPAIGTELSFSSVLPWSLGEVRAGARVVWSNGPESEPPRIIGVGLEFTEFEPGSKDALDAYLQRFAELAAQLDESTPSHDGH